MIPPTLSPAQIFKRSAFVHPGDYTTGKPPACFVRLHLHQHTDQISHSASPRAQTWHNTAPQLNTAFPRTTRTTAYTLNRKIELNRTNYNNTIESSLQRELLYRFIYNSRLSRYSDNIFANRRALQEKSIQLFLSILYSLLFNYFIYILYLLFIIYIIFSIIIR